MLDNRSRKTRKGKSVDGGVGEARGRVGRFARTIVRRGQERGRTLMESVGRSPMTRGRLERRAPREKETREPHYSSAVAMF
jgi:hypothetical protein